MHYKLSVPNSLRLSAKDRSAIEFMLGRLGDSNSMGYYPKGRTGYAISRRDDCYMVSIRRGDEVYEIAASLIAA